MSRWILSIVHGPDTGREVEIGAEGLAIGRAADNDVVLADPAVALYHGRLRLTPEGLPEFEDLFSEAGTKVDGRPVERAVLFSGATITLGGTTLAVAEETGGVDLGLASAPSRRKKPSWRWAAAAVGIAAVFAAAWWFLRERPVDPAAAAEGPAPFDLSYEKVQATATNIFRYALHITPRSIEAEVDDLAQNRHLRRDARLEEDAARHLARQLDEAGFFNLDPVQEGRAGPVHEETLLRLVLGERSHSVRVANRVLPEALASVRDAIEQFGENELGLVALSLSAEEARRRASDAFVRGRQLYQERDVAYGNLYEAIRSFREAQWYLEPIEPKPEAYQEAVHMESVASEELDRRIEDQRFLAEKAIQLRDWAGAGEALRTIVVLLPDRADDRNESARRKLMDVERRRKGSR